MAPKGILRAIPRNSDTGRTKARPTIKHLTMRLQGIRGGGCPRTSCGAGSGNERKDVLKLCCIMHGGALSNAQVLATDTHELAV